MTELQTILEKYISMDLQQIILSGTREKAGPSKVQIRPILLRDNLVYQFAKTVETKELHSNHDREEAIDLICEYMASQFKQLQLTHKKATVNVLVSKKGKMTIKCKEQNNTSIKPRDLSHNRQKNYILNPERKVDFLVDLGVMSKDGKIVNARYDKFRQINRFLEFIEDILGQLPRNREITIVDFGCGKSYLTFAIYHFLKVLKGLDVRIIGLDLKSEVIDKCNKLARKYNYDKLDFIQGDIASYDEDIKVDMVVSLHACDTATDLSLAKAVKWNAAVILAVPCCQHELNGQIKNEVLAPILSYGIIKERMAALMTDGLRAQMLESVGYETQILEFVEMEHTPKNLLIRAVKKGLSENGVDKKASEARDVKELEKCMEFLHASPMLKGLLEQQER